MIVTVIVTQFAIVVVGFAKLDEEFVIKIAFIDVIEGGVAAAAVLISFGAVLGKVNPLQLLFMGLIEAIFVVLNLHIGYHVLGIADVGGTIFIHTFGAYFGLAVSFVLRGQDTSDLFALFGHHHSQGILAEVLKFCQKERNTFLHCPQFQFLTVQPGGDILIFISVGGRIN